MMDEQKTVSEKLAHRLEKFYSGKVVIGFLMPEENQLTIKMADGSYLVITARTSLDLSVLGDEDVPE